MVFKSLKKSLATPIIVSEDNLIGSAELPQEWELVWDTESRSIIAKAVVLEKLSGRELQRFRDMIQESG